MTINIFEIKDWLKGKKTYITCGLAAIAFFAHLLGWISQDVVNQIYTILGITGVATVSAKINRPPAG